MLRGKPFHIGARRARRARAEPTCPRADALRTPAGAR